MKQIKYKAYTYITNIERNMFVNTKENIKKIHQESVKITTHSLFPSTFYLSFNCSCFMYSLT